MFITLCGVFLVLLVTVLAGLTVYMTVEFVKNGRSSGGASTEPFGDGPYGY